MKRVRSLPQLIKIVKNNWKVKYRLVVRDMDTHQDKASLLLSPKNTVVLIFLSVFSLVLLTTFLIAFTPLRMYVPGYTNFSDGDNFRYLYLRIDSLEKKLSANQQYIDNFYHVLNDQIVEEEELIAPVNEKILAKEENNKVLQNRENIKNQLFDETGNILKELNEKTGIKLSPVVAMTNYTTSLPVLLPPAYGLLNQSDENREDKDLLITNVKNTLINSIADGIVIFAGYDFQAGNMLIIQHQENLISVYKHCASLLVKQGETVRSGEPIARMGDSGSLAKGTALRFELWYNRQLINPLHYIVME
jgi:septal ring factor EnvC (AmiA/AmiB activator)